MDSTLFSLILQIIFLSLFGVKAGVVGYLQLAHPGRATPYKCRMAHDEPGPGQTYAIQARQAIAALRRQEIRWCPAQKGIPGNEVADEAPKMQNLTDAERDTLNKQPHEWAKLAASEPDDHGVEWLVKTDGTRFPVRPTSLAHLRRRASKKWEARLV